jgi:hypothetical protein
LSSQLVINPFWSDGRYTKNVAIKMKIKAGNGELLRVFKFVFGGIGYDYSIIILV